MPYVIGVLLAVVVCLFATIVGLDRDRAFYPTMAIVVASYYGLFAVMGGSMRALGAESIAASLFIVLAVAGFRWNPWLLVAALAGHGAFDFIHARVIVDPGVPAWWPPFCLAFDVAAAAYLAVLLSRPGGRQFSNPQAADDLHRDQ